MKSDTSSTTTSLAYLRGDKELVIPKNRDNNKRIGARCKESYLQSMESFFSKVPPTPKTHFRLLNTHEVNAKQIYLEFNDNNNL